MIKNDLKDESIFHNKKSAKLLVATGKSYPNEEKAEIIDLFDPQWKYEFLNPRIARYGAVGNLVQNKSLICGGIRTMSNKKYLQNGLGKMNA